MSDDDSSAPCGQSENGDGTVLLDCDRGRTMSCGNLCCRLMVMLTGEEMARGLLTQSPMSGLLKQGLDGFCHYLDRETQRCSIFEQRPLICRLYNCNTDPKLQVMMRQGFTSFTAMLDEMKKNPPREQWLQIPLIDE